MKVTISGLGLMGASLAMALKQNLPDIEIYGYDLPDILDRAVSLKIIDKKMTNWPEEVNETDIVFLATPLRIIKEHIKDLAKIIRQDIIVTDLGSTKLELYNFCRSIGFQGLYIGGHPMTGAEKNGINAANPLLYENAVYILTDQNTVQTDPVREKLIPLLSAIKARILVLDPELHPVLLISGRIFSIQIKKMFIMPLKS
ncbi:MAG: prephenate dehydrogenase/arogenate dehydrogenase family protein [Calditrichaceae bacterium]